ncbi:MAG: hypothetical protein K9M82_10485 [Deltaproteobacteria bacterium]|nr:hypothetical protein [Deltaproteobacteria bacterium]
MNEDSIEHIVKQRLDSLFAEDEEDGEEGAPRSLTGDEASIVRRLEQAAEALRGGIDSRTVERLSAEIDALRSAREDDPLHRPLLKMMGMLADYLGAALQSADEDALATVDSIIDCMAYLEPGKSASDVDKRKRVHKEIESFKAFRSRIQAGGRAETTQPKPEAERPDEGAERPPAPPVVPKTEPAPRSVRPADAVPAGKEPTARQEAAAPPDLEGLRESVADLNNRTEDILRTLQDHAAMNRELRDTLAGMGTRLEGLASLPAAVRSLQNAVESISAPAPAPREDSAGKPLSPEDLRSCVRDVVDELSGGLDEVRGMPAGLLEMRRAVDEAFPRLQERMNDLRGGIDTIHADLESLRSAIEAMERDRESRETPEDGSPSRTSEKEPGAATWTCFVFQAGGKKYAVDERCVVKSSKSPGGLLKKARDRGGLTLADSAPGLFSTRKGLEPAWSDVSSAEWKQRLYQLVPDAALEGLDHTQGGGVLFLAAGDERYVLFTDRPAEKIDLGHEDEVQMAGGAGSESGATCGSILRPGDGSDFYLILDPERL